MPTMRRTRRSRKKVTAEPSRMDPTNAACSTFRSAAFMLHCDHTFWASTSHYLDMHPIVQSQQYLRLTAALPNKASLTARRMPAGCIIDIATGTAAQSAKWIGITAIDVLLGVLPQQCQQWRHLTSCCHCCHCSYRQTGCSASRCYRGFPDSLELHRARQSAVCLNLKSSVCQPATLLSSTMLVNMHCQWCISCIYSRRCISSIYS